MTLVAYSVASFLSNSFPNIVAECINRDDYPLYLLLNSTLSRKEQQQMSTLALCAWILNSHRNSELVLVFEGLNAQLN